VSRVLLDPCGDLPRERLTIGLGHLHDLNVGAIPYLGDESAAPKSNGRYHGDRFTKQPPHRRHELWAVALHSASGGVGWL